MHKTHWVMGKEVTPDSPKDPLVFCGRRKREGYNTGQMWLGHLKNTGQPMLNE